VGGAVSARHPLEAVLGRVNAFGSLGVVRLAAGDEPASHLNPKTTAFVAQAGVEVGSGRVLVVDDSWVTGSRALSAAATLDATGATVAGVFILGRYLGPSASALSRSWLAEHAIHSPRSARSYERCCMKECLASPGRRNFLS
jgi:hypothetical protein